MYDAIICGAGPAGSVAALVLARSGARVLLLDRAAFPRDKPCAEYLSPEANIVLRDLGIHDAVQALHPAHLRGFRLYPQIGDGFTATFAGASGGMVEREYGLAVSRLQFDATLVQQAARAGADVGERTRVLDVVENDARVVLRVARGGGETTITAPLAVAADGVHSTVARRLGLVERRAPRRIALVTHLSGLEGLDDYGEMHLSPAGGYCGIAPFMDGRANIAMVVDGQEGNRIAGEPLRYFRQALATYPHIASRARRATPCKAILTTSNMSWRTRRPYSGRILLVGDAAGYYDPFTGEGIYNALAGGRLAALHVAAALAGGRVAEHLAAYAAALRHLTRWKHLVARAIDLVVRRPLLFRHVADRLQRRPEMADILVGVTGDFLPVRAIGNPLYLARLLV